MSCCAARRFWNSLSSSTVMESASVVPAASSASAPERPASAACPTTAFTCARTSRMSFSPMCRSTTAPNTDSRKRPFAAKSVCEAGMRGSPRTSNERVCGGAVPDRQASAVRPGHHAVPLRVPEERVRLRDSRPALHAQVPRTPGCDPARPGLGAYRTPVAVMAVSRREGSESPRPPASRISSTSRMPSEASSESDLSSASVPSGG